MAEIPFKVKSV